MHTSCRRNLRARDSCVCECRCHTAFACVSNRFTYGRNVPLCGHSFIYINWYEFDASTSYVLIVILRVYLASTAIGTFLFIFTISSRILFPSSATAFILWFELKRARALGYFQCRTENVFSYFCRFLIIAYLVLAARWCVAPFPTLSPHNLILDFALIVCFTFWFFLFSCYRPKCTTLRHCVCVRVKFQLGAVSGSTVGCWWIVDDRK